MSGLFGLGSSLAAPLLGKVFGLGGAAAAGAAGSAGAAGAGAAGTAATTAAGAGSAGAAGGGGLLSTIGGLATNPITIAAAGALGIGLLAKHFFGNGGDRKAANQLTGPGGVHDFFTQASQQIDQMPDGPEKQQAIDQRDRATEQALVDFSKIDKNHYYQAKQTLEQFSQFSTVKPLLG